MRIKYTKALLEEAVKDSISISGVLRKLGLSEAGGIHAHISRKLKAFKIDTSHFQGRAANCGANHRGGVRSGWQVILIRRASGTRQKAHRLRRALIEAGCDYRCATPGCVVGDAWLGKPITLHVNHRNGDWLDDRAENLEFLCPNCHSQTITLREQGAERSNQRCETVPRV